jgi:carbonic anhydrase
LDAAAALARLVEGNQRYATGGLLHPDQTLERRQELSADQAPFAVVLSCADSCVPPEVIFDQGLGDLYVVRVAGNILSDMVLGSIEYAVVHLQTPLILVLGHQGCPAMNAAVEAVIEGREAAGHGASLLDALRPAVEDARQQSGDVLDNAVRANVKLMLNQLRITSSILEEQLGRGVLKLAGGYHNLDTGGIELVG